MKFVFTLIFCFLFSFVYSQNYKYPGKRDFYAENLFNFDLQTEQYYKGIRIGYFINDFIDVFAETGQAKWEETNKNGFIYKDKINGIYAKIGLEFVSDFNRYIFKKNKYFRIIYGLRYGYAQQYNFRVYKYKGDIFGDKYQNKDFKIKTQIYDFYFGSFYARNKFRLSANLCLGNLLFNKSEFPYTVTQYVGVPHNIAFEISMGYHLLKDKKKPYKSGFESILKFLLN